MIKKIRKIVKEMTISEVLSVNPQAAPLLLNMGMHCLSCPMASEETIEEMAKAYQIDLTKLLESLNEAK